MATPPAQGLNVDAIAGGLTSATLRTSISLLLLRLLDERGLLHYEEGATLVKAVNVLMLKILECRCVWVACGNGSWTNHEVGSRAAAQHLPAPHALRSHPPPPRLPSPVQCSNRTYAFAALLQLLRDPPLSVTPESLHKFYDLVVKCLIKLTKGLQATAEVGGGGQPRWAALAAALGSNVGSDSLRNLHACGLSILSTLPLGRHPCSDVPPTLRCSCAHVHSFTSHALVRVQGVDLSELLFCIHDFFLYLGVDEIRKVGGWGRAGGAGEPCARGCPRSRLAARGIVCRAIGQGGAQMPGCGAGGPAAAHRCLVTIRLAPCALPAALLL